MVIFLFSLTLSQSIGQIFGQQAFFTNQPSSFFARALEFTTTYQIKRRDFIKLLKKYPDDREKFYDLQNKIQFSFRYELVGLRCSICDQERERELGEGNDHTSEACFRVNLRFSQEQLIELARTQALMVNLKRNPVAQRRRPTKYNVLIDLLNVQTRAVKYIDENFQQDSSGESDSSADSQYSDWSEDRDKIGARVITQSQIHQPHSLKRNRYQSEDIYDSAQTMHQSQVGGGGQMSASQFLQDDLQMIPPALTKKKTMNPAKSSMIKQSENQNLNPSLLAYQQNMSQSNLLLRNRSQSQIQEDAPTQSVILQKQTSD